MIVGLLLTFFLFTSSDKTFGSSTREKSYGGVSYSERRTFVADASVDSYPVYERKRRPKIGIRNHKFFSLIYLRLTQILLYRLLSEETCRISLPAIEWEV